MADVNEDKREKLIKKLMGRVMKLLPNISEDIVQGWLIAVPYQSKVDPQEPDGGVHMMSSLQRISDLEAVFEGILVQCLAAEIPPERLFFIFKSSLSRFLTPKPNIVVPGNFSKKPT